GREALATLSDLLDRLATYRAGRIGLSADYPDDAIRRAPLKSWSEALGRAEASVWPLGPLARRRLRKAMCAGLGIDSAAARAPGTEGAAAPAPAGALAGPASLAASRAETAARAARLPAGTPWHGLATELPVARQAVEAGRRLREAAVRLAAFGRDLAETRAQ